MAGDQVLDSAAGEGLAAGTGEQRRGGFAAVLACPGAEHGGCLGGERGDALFAAFAVAADVCPGGAEGDVAASQRGDLGDPQAGLDGEGEKRVVAAAGPGGLVGGGEQRLCLGGSKEGDQVPLEAFGRDGQDPADQGGVLGVAQGGVAEQGVDRGQAGVAGPGAVAPPGFQVGEERGDQRGVQVGQVELAWVLPGAVPGEVQQQPEGVPGRRRWCAGWPGAGR
jgi:hypothetical protein